MDIGTSEIKYKAFTNLNGPSYTILKAMVTKIVYENGATDNFELVQPTIENTEEKRAQNIFFEIGAQGLFFTANYDTRFGNTRSGLGGRVGIGAFSVSGVTVVTAPVSLNYLLGQGNSFFEVGLGATYVKGSTDIFDNEDRDSASTVIGTMAFMYRLQPANSGFAFRGGFTPVFTKDAFIPYYLGISLGYTF